MRSLKLIVVLTLAAILAGPLLAAAPDGLSVTDAWFRSLPAGLPAAGYFALTNKSHDSIELVSASSPDCRMLMLHLSENNNGVSQMSDLSKVDLAAGQTVHFSPGGYHLMCMQPAAALKPGAHVPVTLHFSGGSQITVSFAVRTATGQ